MQLNVLDDLAEAMKAFGRKKKYHLDMVWQQKQREEHQNHKAIPEGE